MDQNVPRVQAAQALAVYAESLAAGARIVVFGDASLGLGDRLLLLGARSVRVFDPDRGRARAHADHAPEGVSIHPYAIADDAGILVDLAIIPDLAMFDHPGALVARLRHWLGDEGVLLLAAENRERTTPAGGAGFDYYELFDSVAKEFDNVRMVAALPFQGMAFLTLGEDSDPPAVTVDSQLSGTDRAADAFVVVASQREALLDPYALVELPPARSHEPDGALRAKLIETQLHSERMELRVRELTEAIEARERASVVATEMEGALRAQAARAAALDAALAERGNDLAALSAEVEEMRSAAEAGQVAAAEFAECAQRADRAERRASALEGELASAIKANGAEVDRLEGALRETALASRRLEAENVRRDQMVRELVATVEELSSGPGRPSRLDAQDGQSEVGRPAPLGADARMREQLDALALELARKEGEAHAAGWTIAELERRIAASTSANSGVGDPLAAALDELDALRRALAQEHEARRKVESGEELARARAEIERQSVLLEQMSRRPEGERDERASDDRPV